jgi:exosortase
VSHKALDSILALPRRKGFWLTTALLALCAWVFWPTFVQCYRAWKTPEYSHGYLVPVFAAYLLYRRRDQIPEPGTVGSWWGLGVLGLACLFRMAGAYFDMEYVDAISLIPCLLGLALLLGGWPGLRWSLPAVLFLLFMLPLPWRIAYGLSGPLRGVATKVAGFTLETLGLPVVIEGYTILLDEHHIAVAEACSGLSMLYVFAALATAVAIVIQRPWLDRVLVLLAAGPIAVAANVARITATAFAFWMGGKELGDFIFHDLAGWLMMPLALGLLWAELKLIDLILVPEPDYGVDHAVPGMVPYGAAAEPPASPRDSVRAAVKR